MARSSPSPPMIGRASYASLPLLYLHRGGRFDLDQAGADHLCQRRHRREVVENRDLDGLRRGCSLAIVAVEADENVAGVGLRWVVDRPARRDAGQAMRGGAPWEAEEN